MSDYAVQNTQVVDAILKLSQLPTLPVASATLYWKVYRTPPTTTYRIV